MINTLVYFSSSSRNTERFVEKIVNFSKEYYPLLRKNGEKVDIPPLNPIKIPISMRNETIVTDIPFILVTPTYGGTIINGKKDERMVPLQVQKFMEEESNTKNIKGVIGTGNINFGSDYGKAANIISNSYKVPLLYKAELMGTEEDIKNIAMGMLDFA